MVLLEEELEDELLELESVEEIVVLSLVDALEEVLEICGLLPQPLKTKAKAVRIIDIVLFFIAP